VSFAISTRDRRTLALGAAAVALLLLLGRGVPAWRRWDAEVRASAAEMTGEAARAGTAVRTLPALRDSAAARRRRLAALDSALLEGESAASAGAALASLLSSAAEESGVQLGAVQVAPADSAGRGVFARVRVRADATGDLPGLLLFLRALEGGRALVSVQEWAVTQPSAGGPAEFPEALRLELAVEGLARVRPAGGRP
jgi:hypothetical protein